MRKRRKENGGFICFGIFAAICIGQPVLAAKVKAPTGLKADYDKNYIKLTWKKVPKARGYVVYRYSSTAGQYIRVKSTRKNYHSMSGLPEGTLYRFKVKAYRKIGGKLITASIVKGFQLRTKKQKTKRVSTIKKYLKSAIQPLGKVVYVWGRRLEYRRPGRKHRGSGVWV